MSEEELLAAIRAAPDDDGPRLVYGDWRLEQGDWRGELIQVQCQLAARAGPRARRRAKGSATRKQLQAREAELLTRWGEARPAWAATWPPTFARGFAVQVVVHDLATFLARDQELRRQHPLASVALADGSRVATSADGLRYAVLTRLTESAGSIASSTSTVTTTVTVFDRAGTELHRESREEDTFESSSGHTWGGGDTITGVALSADGRTLSLTLSTGTSVTREV